MPPTPALPPMPHANILVVDDDRRVRELLEIALTAHGFGVLTAADGDEAVKRAASSRPDLVVLDMRLPKKSGLEVCEILRKDPEDPTVPIILVSAQAETDARLQAFSRGADDYMSKPFSPKELIARVERLLLRSLEARAALRRASDLERELVHAREEARRAGDESRREQRMRELATGLGRELLSSPDLDGIAQRLLATVQSRLRVGTVGLLARDGARGILVPCAVRGDGYARIAELELKLDGELAGMLAGLSRPAPRVELERIPELASELGPFVAGRIDLLVPLAGPAGLEALLIADERTDGLEHTRADLDMLAGLCEIGAVAIQNAERYRAQADRLLEIAAEGAPAGPGVGHVAEASSIVVRAAKITLLTPSLHLMVRRTMTLGPWSRTHEGRRALERVRTLDPSGQIAAIERLLDRASTAPVDDSWTPEQHRADVLVRAGFEYVVARDGGQRIVEAMEAALARMEPALDPSTRHALVEAAREESLAAEAALTRRSA